MSKNYPDTTFEGDPTAPWNEETPKRCSTCSFAYAMFGDLACMRRIDVSMCKSAQDVVAEVEQAMVLDFDSCVLWEAG